MKRAFIGILGTTLLLTAKFTDLSRGQDAIVPRIINGTPTDDFPSVGIVGTEELGGIGTGTLISPRHVLTAAHLADWVESPTGGTFELNGTRYTTSSVFIHEDYNRFSLENDIAIYELREVVDGVQPSPIYTGTPRVGQEVTLVGYGAGGDGNTGQDGAFGVKMVGTNTIDDVTATKIYWLFDSNDESNTAYGDSGGPAFLYVDGEFLVAGVTSAGSTPDSVIGDVAISTRVDAFAEWIDTVVATVDDGTVDDGRSMTARRTMATTTRRAKVTALSVSRGMGRCRATLTRLRAADVPGKGFMLGPVSPLGTDSGP